ncbi:MAG TPA: ATP-binding protein [Pyrinomonadaceae bacterium]|nr:ATP-binding protein [Pyrinomonadaceae bacterium]
MAPFVKGLSSKWWARYGLALLLFGLIFGLSQILSQYGIRLNLTIPVVVGLVAASWWGGRGPGLFLALAITASVIVYAPRPEDPSGWPRAIFGYVSVALLLGFIVLLISGRKKAVSKLREQREFLQVTLASIGDAVIATDKSGRITFINPAAATITGWQQAEACDQPIEKVLRVSDEVSGEDALPSLLETETPKDGENHPFIATLSLRQPDGTRLPVDAKRTPILNSDGETVGSVIVFNDITPRRTSELEREHLLLSERRARNEAEAANRLKDEFLATVSHELRTPLNAILGWAALLRKSSIDGEHTDRALSVIERNAKIQNTLISDILDVSSIITGKLKMEMRPVNVIPVVREAIETAYPSARAKNVTIETEFKAVEPEVAGDAERLQQVFWNLLANAIKFTPAGGNIRVKVTTVAGAVQISVRDSGIGIDPASIPYVFERFRQVDSSIKRTHGGLGLGLAIVRHLAELHGGTVTAESKGEGHGTMFSVELPLLARQTQGAETNGRPDARPDLTGVRVLVVDDHSDTLEIFRRSLEQYGAVTQGAQSCSAALDVFDEWQPNVVITDLGMPGEDGYDLIQSIRSRNPAEGGDVPMAAVTAYAHEEERAKTRAAGFQKHITKPVDTRELAGAVAELARSV